MPAGSKGCPVITWDTERFPDYRTFLDVARKAGEKLILFASREMAEDEIDEALEELEETEFTREERRELEGRAGESAKGISARPARSNWLSITTRTFTSMRRGRTGTRISSTPATRSPPLLSIDDDDEGPATGSAAVSIPTISRWIFPAVRDDGGGLSRNVATSSGGGADSDAARISRRRERRAAFSIPGSKICTIRSCCAIWIARWNASAQAIARRRTDRDSWRLRRGRRHLHGDPEEGAGTGGRRIGLAYSASPARWLRDAAGSRGRSGRARGAADHQRGQRHSRRRRHRARQRTGRRCDRDGSPPAGRRSCRRRSP